MRLRRWLALAGGLALVAAGGCSRGNTGTFATVSGKVTLNGAAADGVKVTLHSTVEAGGKKAGPFSAMTDSSGHYVIATVGKDPGIPPGMYKVTVTKLDMKGNVPPDFDQGQLEASGQAINL